MKLKLTDPLLSDPAALWAFEAADNGYVRARNLATGSYLQIENTLSAQPVAFRPYYAKQDNGKMAFFMDATEAGKRLFNVGVAEADGTGQLEFFSAHADRTRLRWVIEETDVEVETTTAIADVADCYGKQRQQVYNLKGQRVRKPTKGLYIVDGVIRVVK